MKRSRKGLRTLNIDNSIVYRLYNTNIITTNGTFLSLNSNGWRTNHTKNCMNDNLPQGFKVFQKNFDWFLETPKGVVRFEDEMVITLETSEVTYA